MKAKVVKSPSYIESLLDKYIYYVLINKNHKKQVMNNLRYSSLNNPNLNLA